MASAEKEPGKNGIGPMQEGFLEKSMKGQILWGEREREEKGFPDEEEAVVKCKGLRALFFVESLFNAMHYTKCFLYIFICFNSINNSRKLSIMLT